MFLEHFFLNNVLLSCSSQMSLRKGSLPNSQTNYHLLQLILNLTTHLLSIQKIIVDFVLNYQFLSNLITIFHLEFCINFIEGGVFLFFLGGGLFFFSFKNWLPDLFGVVFRCKPYVSKKTTCFQLKMIKQKQRQRARFQNPQNYGLGLSGGLGARPVQKPFYVPDSYHVFSAEFGVVPGVKGPRFQEHYQWKSSSRKTVTGGTGRRCHQFFRTISSF